MRVNKKSLFSILLSTLIMTFIVACTAYEHHETHKVGEKVVTAPKASLPAKINENNKVKKHIIDGASFKKPVDLVKCGDNRPQICTKEYRPVCAQKDTGVRCVNAPCNESIQYKTYGNACTACADTKVYGYSLGACR